MIFTGQSERGFDSAPRGEDAAKLVRVYDIDTRRHALALLAEGLSLSHVSKVTGISSAAIQSWTVRVEPRARGRSCDRCRAVPRLPAPAADYAYLLGLYLGDGYLSRTFSTYELRIYCADAWPGLMEACEATLRAVLPESRVSRRQGRGCVGVGSFNPHWPCLLPQHGPGRKHNRTIALEPWQQSIVHGHPWEFTRGLIHSDGCRITNWATRLVGGERKRYEYPRYFFTNKSDDIRRLYTDTLDRLGVAWKQANAWNVSVARRESVALMDEHVGPKY